MKDVERVHRELYSRVRMIFGEPVKVYREFAPARDAWEWTIFARLFGRRARFDVGLGHTEMSRMFAVDALIAQLSLQIMDQHEKDLLEGYKPYFDVDRKRVGNLSTTVSSIWPEIEDEG